MAVKPSHFCLNVSKCAGKKERPTKHCIPILLIRVGYFLVSQLEFDIKNTHL